MALKEEASKIAAAKQAEIDQLHKQLQAQSSGIEGGDALNKAMEEQSEKDSRINELEEKLKKAGAMESRLRSSLTNKAKEVAAQAGAVADMRRKIAEQEVDNPPGVETASQSSSS